MAWPLWDFGESELGFQKSWEYREGCQRESFQVMRPKFTFVLLGLVLAGLAVLILLTGKPPELVPPRVVFTGKAPSALYQGEGFPQGAAGFSITNPGSFAISIWQIQIQVLSNDVWRTVFQGPPEISPVAAGASIKIRLIGCVEPGGEQKFLAPMAGQGHWRARFSYGREITTEARLVTIKIRNAWRSPAISCWQVDGRGFYEFGEIVSGEISN